MTARDPDDMSLNLDSIVAVGEKQASTEIDGEVVILGFSKNHYFGLDEVGARVWELLQTPRSVRDLCDALLEEYDVGADDCTRDVLNLLQELNEENLLHIHDPEPTD